MGLAALPNTRRALAHDFTPGAFLTKFRSVYFVLALSYCVMLWLNAALLRGKWLARETSTLIALGILACWLTAEEPGFGFYWIDGYGNVLMPFVLLTGGLTLLARSRRLLPALAGGISIVLAALGHEVMCIYALGVLGLFAALRRPRSDGWARWSVCLGLLAICGAILAAQLFSAGPRVRGDHYQRATGAAYHYDIALQNVLQIKPVPALLCVLATILAIGVYRDHLGGLPERVVADYAQNRVFWLLLAAGTFLTSLLPLASVGLSKGRIIVSLYSTLTHLFFVLLGFVLSPVLDGVTERLLRGYRHRVGSVLPIVLLLWLSSDNRESFQQAVVRHTELKGQALSYMTKLFEARKHLNLCRPDHPYVKRAKGLTDRGEADYFHLERVRHRCPEQDARLKESAD